MIGRENTPPLILRDTRLGTVTRSADTEKF
jgi:hypothetical protein